MQQQSVTDAFMVAYIELSPNVGELSELRKAGVSAERSMALYPLQVAEVSAWLLAALGEEWTVRSKFSEELVARSSVTSVHGRAKFEAGPKPMSNEHRVAFFEDGYDDLISSAAGRLWTSGPTDRVGQTNAWAQRLVAELLWIGTHWKVLPELHAWEREHVADLELLAYLLAEAKQRLVPTG